MKEEDISMPKSSSAITWFWTSTWPIILPALTTINLPVHFHREKICLIFQSGLAKKDQNRGNDRPSLKSLLSRSNSNSEPVLLWGKGTGIFFIILTEGIVGSVKINLHLSSGHWLDIEIASLLISFYPGGLIFEGKEKLVDR